MKPQPNTTNKLLSPAQLMVQSILEQRERILSAFIAETGLMPSDCEQVVSGNKWWVRKRATTGI